MLFRSLCPRPLVTKFIQQHLDDFGLDQEFGTYGKIGGLSGGQKVKLVLAAAMWNCPHLLVLDEPTNFLDREALGAFATAIREFQVSPPCHACGRRVRVTGL